jgi:tight adherence protein C
MKLYLILIVTFVAIFTLIYLVFRYLRNRYDPAVQRMKELEQERMTKTVELARRPSESRWPVNLSIEKILEQLGQIAQVQDKPNSQLRQTMISAGFHSDSFYSRVRGMKIFSAIAAFFLFTFLGVLGHGAFVKNIFIAVMASLAFFNLPDIVLGFIMRRRQAEIGAALPDALDLLVICVEAGLALNASIMRVGQDLALRFPTISQELMRTTQDLRTGISRERALRALAERNRVEDLKILVGSLILADRLGTSIADTLRVQSDSLRTRIRQKAEEQAAKAGVKMLLPLVLFILPALFIILMGPAVIMMLQTLKR